MRSMLLKNNWGALAGVVRRSQILTPNNAANSNTAIVEILLLSFTHSPANIMITPKTVVAIIAFIFFCTGSWINLLPDCFKLLFYTRHYHPCNT